MLSGEERQILATLSIMPCVGPQRETSSAWGESTNCSSTNYFFLRPADKYHQTSIFIGEISPDSCWVVKKSTAACSILTKHMLHEATPGMSYGWIESLTLAVI